MAGADFRFAKVKAPRNTLRGQTYKMLAERLYPSIACPRTKPREPSAEVLETRQPVAIAQLCEFENLIVWSFVFAVSRQKRPLSLLEPPVPALNSSLLVVACVIHDNKAARKRTNRQWLRFVRFLAACKRWKPERNGNRRCATQPLQPKEGFPFRGLQNAI